MKRFRRNEKGGAGVVALLLVILILAVGTAVLVVIDNGSIGKSQSMDAIKITTDSGTSSADDSKEIKEPEPIPEPEPEPEPESLLPEPGDDYKEVNAKKIASKYCIIVDADENKIIAGTGYDKKMYPASLTKLMTLLVAVENADDMKATYKFTSKDIDPLIEQEASRVGFEPGEKVTVKDMLYGTALCSGADATTGLAKLISGSEKEFVELMNKKAEELGMDSTHFVNASGLYNKNHISSCQDMAALLKACLENKTCKKILSAEKYTTAKTKVHPDGMELYSIVFQNIYNYGQDPDFEIGGGKTGYTDEAGTLLASYLEYPETGKTYIAVTSKGLTQADAVLDNEYLYHTYVVKPAQKAAEEKSEDKEETKDEEKTEDDKKSDDTAA
ncbi:MAG: D-alanyl-D-alanine carboxypeptidase [Ruminococcus sp.]|nr:D-alanyl-D-alanine carboxypeptidase [Ruminococcus sp.]